MSDNRKKVLEQIEQIIVELKAVPNADGFVQRLENLRSDLIDFFLNLDRVNDEPA